jgi:cytochrome c oxidase subunit 3
MGMDETHAGAMAMHGGHAAASLPRDAHFADATPGKIGMWIFLVSDAFSFAGMLIGYGILRNGEAVWRAPGEPALSVAFAGGLTVLLIASSVTNVLGWAAAAEGRRDRASLLLAATALLGLLFLVGQAQEWWGIWSPGLMREGLPFGSSLRAATFYVITGWHGLHVAAGVVYILAILAQYRRGVVHAGHLEVLSLFWCFVDLVWVFVFSFLYLFP